MTGVPIVPLVVKHVVLVPFRVFSLKRSTGDLLHYLLAKAKKYD